MKNLIDWVSREKPMPWQSTQILLMSASPSMVGGNRGFWAAHSRQNATIWDHFIGVAKTF